MMETRKPNDNLGFTKIDNTLFELQMDGIIDIYGFGVIVLISRWHNSGGLKATQSYICKALNLSRNTVRRTLRDLEEEGLIEINKKGLNYPIYTLTKRFEQFKK